MRRITWLFLAVLVMAVGSAEAATYWVSKSSNGDGTTCFNSATQPSNLATQTRLTIDGGVACLASGDTLNILAGTYVESGIGIIPSGGGEGTRTVVQGAPSLAKTAVIIQSSSGEAFALGQPMSYVTIRNLTIDGANQTGADQSCFGYWGGPAHMLAEDLELKNCPRSGIDVGWNAGSGEHGDFNTFRRITVHNWGKDPAQGGHGIYIRTSDTIIEDCLFYDGGGWGIHILNSEGGGQFAHRGTVRNNIIHDFGILDASRPSYSLSAGIVVGSGDDHLVYNNLIYRGSGEQGQVGISLYGLAGGPSDDNSRAFNNTIYNMRDYGIEIRNSGVTNALVRNNIVHTAGDRISNNGSNTTFSNNLCDGADTGCAFTQASATAVFVSPSTTNFQLVSGSTAIDNGTSLSGIFTTDILGVTRSGTWDIGAYEFVQADPTPPDCTGDTLTLTVNSSSQITLDWTACTDANLTGYKIYRCLDAEGDSNCTPTFLVTQSGTGVSYPSTGLAASTQYGYLVYATDGTNDTVIPGGVKYATTQAAPAPTLIAQYGFETGTNPPQDTSGNNLHANAGTTVGTTYVAGKLGTWALHCNGTTSVVTINDNDLLDLSTAFTLMMWVRPGVLQTGYTSLLVKDPTYAYFLYSTHGDATPVNVPAGGYYDSATTYEEVWDTSVLPASVWTHIALTWDGVTLIWYRNGVAGTPVPNTGTISPTTGVLTLCARPPTTAEYFNGDVDDVRIYDGALSEATIDSIIAEANTDTLAPAAPTNLRVVP